MEKTKRRGLRIVKYVGLGGLKVILFFKSGKNVRALSDVSALFGVVILSVSALLSLAQKGAFSGADFIFYRLKNLFLPNVRRLKTYREYRESKEEKSNDREKQSVKKGGWSGGALLFLSVIFALLYCYA